MIVLILFGEARCMRQRRGQCPAGFARGRGVTGGTDAPAAAGSSAKAR